MDEIENEYEGAERQVGARERKRQHPLYVLLDDHENERLAKIIMSTGKRKAAIVRSWILGQRLPARSLDEFVSELRRLGRLFRHTAWGKDADGQHLQRHAQSELLQRADEIAAIAAKAEIKAKNNEDEAV